MLAGQGSVSAHTHPRGERVSAADFAAALANHPRVNKFGNRFRVRCADAAATPRRLGGIRGFLAFPGRIRTRGGPFRVLSGT